jgi:hypothetical protein
MRNTNAIKAVLVDTADEINIPPSNLLRDQSGTLVVANSTPV